MKDRRRFVSSIEYGFSFIFVGLVEADECLGLEFESVSLPLLLLLGILRRERSIWYRSLSSMNLLTTVMTPREEYLSISTSEGSSRDLKRCREISLMRVMESIPLKPETKGPCSCCFGSMFSASASES